MDASIEQYFEALKTNLRDLPSSAVDEIVLELRSHVVDRLAEGDGTPESVRRVLEALGRPEEIASEYRVQRLLSEAGRRPWPWLVLSGTAAWAKHRARGAFVFAFISLCYLSAVVLLACAVLKPFWPRTVGLWSGPSHWVVGVVEGEAHAPVRVVGLTIGISPPSFIIGRPGHAKGPYSERLGFWLIPASLAASIGLIYFGTHVARRSIRSGANLVAERLARA